MSPSPVLSLSDVMNLASGPGRGGAPAPAGKRLLTLADVQQLASGSGPADAPKSFGEAWWNQVNPLHSVPGLWRSLTTMPGFQAKDEDFQAAHEFAQKMLEADRTGGGPGYGEIAGNAAGMATNAALLAGITYGVAKGYGVAAEHAGTLADLATDPAVLKAGLKILPKGEAAVKFAKIAKAALDKSKAARAVTTPSAVQAEVSAGALSPEDVAFLQRRAAAEPAAQAAAPIADPPASVTPAITQAAAPEVAPAITAPETPAITPPATPETPAIAEASPAPAAVAAPEAAADAALEQRLQDSIDEVKARKAAAAQSITAANRVAAADRWAAALGDLGQAPPALGDDAAWGRLQAL